MASAEAVRSHTDGCDIDIQLGAGHGEDTQGMRVWGGLSALMLIIRISFDTFIGAAVRADISHFAGHRSRRRKGDDETGWGDFHGM